MSKHVCPDHPLATWRGLLGDYYCTASGCDWWYMPVDEEDARIYEATDE